MTIFEFDGDDGDDDYCLVAEKGSVGSSGYGMFIDSIYGYKSIHSYYSYARRYSILEVERIRTQAELRTGKPCVIIKITH